ncbi:hypothetical protein AMECASPLE_039619 [Ameca splendens]|uniref:Uncharacterized protein n=1 Tax=Ameca splendens TaxID=208324 RepID=A0ABV0YJL4_9TELE
MRRPKAKVFTDISLYFETLENTIEDRGPVEEEERRKRMQVVERFQTAPSEEIAALCGSRLRHLLKSSVGPRTSI